MGAAVTRRAPASRKLVAKTVKRLLLARRSATAVDTANNIKRCPGRRVRSYMLAPPRAVAWALRSQLPGEAPLGYYIRVCNEEYLSTLPASSNRAWGGERRRNSGLVAARESREPASWTATPVLPIVTDGSSRCRPQTKIPGFTFGFVMTWLCIS